MENEVSKDKGIIFYVPFEQSCQVDQEHDTCLNKTKGWQ